MDPRMKIVLMLLLMVSIFLCKNYLSLAIVLAVTVFMVLISKINLKIIFKGLKPIILIVVITTLLNLFYGSGEPLVKLWIFKITLDGINTSIFMALRIILLVIMGLMLTYTTTPTALTDAIESLLKPLKLFKVDVNAIAMTMTIALRFIPTLLEEVDKIMAAQKSRGADMESGGIIKRVKAVIPIMIPLFVSSFRRANELAYAMECRCYRGGDSRTKMNVMKMHIRDYISLACVVIYFVAIVIIKIFMSNVV
jgi:energy-coupling factor transport system permease protein